MIETLSNFIRRRLGELTEEERKLRSTLAVVREEQDQLHLAARAAGVEVEDESGGGCEVAQIDGKDEVVSRSPRRASERTIKEAVLDILQWQGSGMTAVDILAQINERFGFDYPRTSLSPQLSRLKSEGKLVRDGLSWRVADASAQTNEAAGAFPKEASPAASITGSEIGASDQPSPSSQELERQVAHEKKPLGVFT